MNQNGFVVFSTLRHIGRPATVREVAELIDSQAHFGVRKLMKTIRHTLTGGVNLGFIEFRKRKYSVNLQDPYTLPPQKTIVEYSGFFRNEVKRLGRKGANGDSALGRGSKPAASAMRRNGPLDKPTPGKNQNRNRPCCSIKSPKMMARPKYARKRKILKNRRRRARRRSPKTAKPKRAVRRNATGRATIRGRYALPLLNLAELIDQTNFLSNFDDFQ